MRVVYDVNEFLPAALSQSNTVIHLHGSLRAPESMILTTHHYIQHYANDRLTGDATRENRVLTFLEHLFDYKTVLFIGYGLEELEILEYVILRTTPSTRHRQFAPYAPTGDNGLNTWRERQPAFYGCRKH